MMIESGASRAEMLKCVETLRHECENISLDEAWQFCEGINKRYTNWAHLMKLREKNTCEALKYCNLWRDFQNKILSKATCELHWNWTLWMLCLRVSSCGIELKNMDQRVVFELWCKTRVTKFVWKNVVRSSSFVWTIKILSTCHLKGIFKYCLSHWKASNYLLRKIMSHEMKVDMLKRSIVYDL